MGGVYYHGWCIYHGWCDYGNPPASHPLRHDRSTRASDVAWPLGSVPNRFVSVVSSHTEPEEVLGALGIMS